MLNTLAPFRGQGFSGSSPSTQDDNIFSTDMVEMLLGISEGPIAGLEDGAKGFHAGDTTFVDADGNSNVGQFDLIHLRGSELGADIVSRLGGFGVSTTVNSPDLVYNVPLVRQGSHPNINFIDIRLVINRLGKDDDDGAHNSDGSVKIEYRKVGDTDWKPIKTTTNYPPPADDDDGNNKERHRAVKKPVKFSPSPGDRVAYWQNSAPPTTIAGSIWFDSGNGNKPMKLTSDGSWIAYPDATQSGSKWTWTDKSAWGNDTSYTAFSGTTKPKGAKQGDFWLRDPDSDIGEVIGHVYLFNGNAFALAAGSLSPSTFSGDDGRVVILDDGVIQFTGRISSPTPQEFRIPVPSIAGTYELRVTNTREIDDAKHFFSVTWESFQEVTNKVYNFPGLATTQVVVGASDQFTSIPDMWGIYKGRIVKVPSNYNPVTRTYGAGVWDGTWKNAYTNNPAFLGNDLVENDRYGMNAYYPVTIRPIDVYAAGQWCDHVCADGKPRFTFNGLLTEPKDGREAVNYMFGIFGGRFFDDGDGMGVIKIDDDGVGSMLFTPENVQDGQFVYSFTDISSRANYYTVSFINPDLDWETDKRLVIDQNHIDKYGRIPATMEAVGCTDEQEAVRRAKYKLITSTTETMMVNFKTNRMGLYAEPYQIILIAHDSIEAGLSARILSTPSRDRILLRDPIYLEPGFNYTIAFQYLNDVTYEMLTIDVQNNTSGSLTALNLQSNLPADIPDNMTFAIQRRDGSAAPKAFRIMSIGENEDDPDNVEIQAIEVNRNKWLYVDGYLHSPLAVERVNLGKKALPKPVDLVRCKAEAVKSGRHWTYDVHLDWPRSPTKKVTKYRMYYSEGGSSTAKIGETTHTQFTLKHVPKGDYVFSVTAVTVDDFESEPVFIEHRLRGDFSDYDDIENLKLVDHVGSANLYESRSPTIRWDQVDTVRLDKYVIQSLIPGTNTVLGTYRADDNRFRYHFDDNRDDNGGTPARQIKLGVAAKLDSGKLGDFSYITINNPAPAVLENVNVEDTVAGAFITFKKPAKRDYAGVIVHASQTDGFTPSDDTEVFRGDQNNIRVKLDKHKTWYIRLAAFDVFGTVGLNFTPQFAVNTDQTGDGTVTPGTIAGDASVMFSNKRIISKAASIHWSGNTIGTKYVEEVVLSTTRVRIKNDLPRKVFIDLTLGVKNLVDGSSSPKDTRTYVDSQLYYEARKSTSSTWQTLAKVKATSMVYGAKDIQNSTKSRKFDLTHRVSDADAGIWEYRARLVTNHRNGNSGNLSAADVFVTVISNINWSKN